MPDNSANRAAMRAAGHSIRAYASFIVGTVVASGTLAATPPYPMGGVSPYIAPTYVTGAYTDVQYGMEIAFFDTATGAFKGRTHVRYGGTIDALNIPVREFTQAMLNLAAGDTFRVYSEWRLRDKLVAALNDFPPDMRFYADAEAGDQPEPVVNSGGDWAGMVDNYGTSSEAAYATVPMTGSTSFTVYPTGGTVSHTWTLPSGVSFAPGSSASDADPVLRATPGTYVLTHEGEDDASGKVRASHPSIRVHNASDPPHRVIATRYEGTAEDGWNWEIEVVSGAVDFTTIPDGCKCILWGRERINGAWQSFRNASPGRAHILGVGYVARDTSAGDEGDGVHTLTFEAISPLARMKQLKSYSKVMLEAASPNSWSEVTELGVIRGFLQVLQFYTMWIEAGLDAVIDDDVLDERYPAHFLDASDFYTQLVELPKAIDARMICDRTGRLDVHTHPAHIPLADRAAVTVALELADADILDYEFTREHHVKVEQMKVSGISGGASGNLPVFSLYPGKSPGEGIDAPEIARLILDATSPQDDINERAGRYGALADMLFYDEDGIRHNAFDLKLTLRGSYDCFDFYKEYIELTITDNRRGLDFSGRRFYLLDSSTAFDEDDGTTTTSVTLRMETNAAEGETYIPPEDTTGSDDGQPPPWEPPITVPDTHLQLGTGRYIIIDNNNQLFYTSTGNSAEPVWTLVPLTLTGSSSDFIADPFCPLYLNGSGDLWLRVTTATHIYLLEIDTSDFSLTATDQATISSAGLYYRRIEMERGTPGFVVVLSTDTGGDALKVTTTTDGSTWGSEVTINSGVSFYAVPGVFPSGRVPGKLVVTESLAAGAWVGKVSTNYGASFSTISVPAIGDSDGEGGFGLHFPYHNNFDESLCFYGEQFGGDGATRYRIIRVQGSTKTDVSPTFGGSTGGVQHTRAIDSAPNNRLRMAACIRNGTTAAGDPGDQLRVGYCVDGCVSGASWQFVTALDGTGGGGGYNFVRVLGDGSGFIAGGTGARLALCDFAGNSRSISGNLAALGCQTITNIVGY